MNPKPLRAEKVLALLLAAASRCSRVFPTFALFLMFINDHCLGTIDLDLSVLSDLGVARIVTVGSSDGHYHAAPLVEALQEIVRLSPL